MMSPQVNFRNAQNRTIKYLQLHEKLLHTDIFMFKVFINMIFL